MDTLQLSNHLATTVENVGKSVVRIEARRRRPASGIVWSTEGVIVSNHHAIEREDGIEVGLPAGTTVGARVLGRDPSTDVAVLQAETGGLTSIPTEALSDLRVGNIVVALARPGRTTRATWGIVSALGSEAWRTPFGGEVERYLEADLGLAPGFSGGPLVDVRGRFLGMTSSAFTRPGTAVIPVATLNKIVDAVRQHGGVKRGYLGVGAYPIRLSSMARTLAGQSRGLLLLSVEPSGPAESAGLLQGDTLLALDGAELGDIDDLLTALAKDTAGKQVELKVLRAGAVQGFSVKAGSR